MIETTVDLATADGAMSTFITHPETGGPHPAVILYMDAPGIREELRDFARRMATVGYFVLLPNLYYRDGGPSFPVAAERTEEDSKRMFALMDALTNARILEDTRPLIDHTEADSAASAGSMRGRVSRWTWSEGRHRSFNFHLTMYSETAVEARKDWNKKMEAP